MLSELNAADNKFLFTLTLLMEHGILLTTLNLDAPDNSDRSMEACEKWIQDWEHAFDLHMRGEFKEAAHQYSRPRTGNHTQVLIHRSVTLSKMGMYKSSLKDLRIVLRSKYPSVPTYMLMSFPDTCTANCAAVKRLSIPMPSACDCWTSRT